MLALSFFVAVLVAGCVFLGLVYLLDFQEIDNAQKLDAKTLFDMVKLSFGVVAGAGALVALVVAYRRQRVDEAGAHREATRLHTERFSQAVDKLGSDSPAVRLGGVHALAGLADDAPDDDLRQTCIDVLCAYLRLPSPSDPGDLPDLLPDGTSPTDEQRDAHQAKRDRYLALREVRHTILRLIGDHYRIPAGVHRSWQGCNLDLTRVTIDGPLDFTDAVFSDGQVNFASATFSNSTVRFTRATFSGSDVNFTDAKFSSSYVFFDEATFSSGSVFFLLATFAGGIVRFIRATFSGSYMNFIATNFSGGDVRFTGAMFAGGEVQFCEANFSGGDVCFTSAVFSNSGVNFSEAMFSGGNVDFDRSTGPAPAGILEAAGTPVPAEVRLRPDWLPAG